MRGNQILSFLFLFGLILSYVGIFIESYAKLTSLGTLMLLCSVVLKPDSYKKLTDNTVLIFAIPVLFAISNFIRSGGTNTNFQELYVILGMLVIAASITIYKDLIIKNVKTLGLIALAILLVVNIASISNYFLNREYHDQMLLQSKSIPIILGMHHIHFGVLNALAIGILLHELLVLKSSQLPKWILPGALGILAVSFHILSSRTGLVSFYAAFLLTVIVYSLKTKNFKPVVSAVLVAFVLNAIAFGASSSFRSKLSNSIEDVNSWGKGDEINYKSMAMRIEAYKVSALAMQDRWLLGYGAEDLESTIQNIYEEINTPLYKENRVGPHNQYLEYGIKYGILGLLFVFTFYLFWFFKSLRSQHYGLMIISLILACSCVFESLHERQVSAFLVACSLPVIFLYKADELTIKQH